MKPGVETSVLPVLNTSSLSLVSSLPLFPSQHLFSSLLLFTKVAAQEAGNPLTGHTLSGPAPLTYAPVPHPHPSRQPSAGSLFLQTSGNWSPKSASQHVCGLPDATNIYFGDLNPNTEGVQDIRLGFQTQFPGEKSSRPRHPCVQVNLQGRGEGPTSPGRV